MVILIEKILYVKYICSIEPIGKLNSLKMIYCPRGYSFKSDLC